MVAEGIETPDDLVVLKDLGVKFACSTRIDGAAGVVVTHPHPLYGGDMENGVVESIIRAYRSKGYSTLRFNFRGTGMSQGLGWKDIEVIQPGGRQPRLEFHGRGLEIFQALGCRASHLSLTHDGGFAVACVVLED